QGSVGEIAGARILPAAEIILTAEAVAGADGPLREIDFSRTLPEVRDQWLTDTERVRSGAYFDGIEGFQAYLDPAQPTLLDHLPQDALILSLDGRRSLTQAEQREQELQELMAVEIERGELPQGLRPGLVSMASLRQAAGGPGRPGQPAGGAGVPRPLPAARGLRRHRPLRWPAPAGPARRGAGAHGDLGAGVRARRPDRPRRPRDRPLHRHAPDGR